MKLVARLRALFRKERVDTEMAEEMKLHLDLQTERNVSSGLTEDEARDEARRQFGQPEIYKEIARDQRSIVWLEQLLQDLRYATRQLRRNPAFTAVVVTTLALAIGANTAIFSFFRGVLLRPLPYAEAERLVVLKKSASDFGDFVGGDLGLFAADYIDLQHSARTVDSLATFTAETATLTGRGEPSLVYGAVVSPNFFSTLGSSPAEGRTLSAEDRTSTGRVVVLSHSFWESHFGRDRSVLGQTLILNQVVFTIIGVMPADFDFPLTAKFWASPAGRAPENQIGAPAFNANGRGNAVRSVFGRLGTGVSLAQSEQEFNALVQQLPNPNSSSRSLHLVTMRDQTVGNVRPALAVLLGCVGLVLLIACLNVANLFLSRATTRQREISVRVALGSSRGRIARQLITESLFLSLLGGAAGVLLSSCGLDALVRSAPADIPRLAAVQIDGWVLGFALALTILTGLVCGLAPVVESAKTNLISALKAGGRGGSGTGWSHRLRGGLVASEVAISLILLVAAGLLLRSFWQMQAVPWGFASTNVVSARVVFMDARYDSNAARLTFYRTLLDKLEQVPGFDQVGTSLDRIGESWVHAPFTPQGRTYPNADAAPQANIHLLVSPNYFRALGIPLIQGRAFEAKDGEGSNHVVIIDAAIARRYFGDGPAVGKQIEAMLFGTPIKAQVIGVVGDVKTDGPQGDQRPDLYIPFPQFPWNNFYLHIRTSVGVAAAGQTIKRLVSEIDGGVPITDLASMDQVIEKPANALRFPLGLLGTFAVLALTLAAIGIYGVTSYSVAQRRREIGVRMALGAQPLQVLRLTLQQSFKPIGLGLCVGLGSSVAAAFAMQKMLFGIGPLDLGTFVAIILILSIVALLATIIPARQAAKVDPMIALRGE